MLMNNNNYFKSNKIILILQSIFISEKEKKGILG